MYSNTTVTVSQFSAHLHCARVRHLEVENKRVCKTRCEPRRAWKKGRHQLVAAASRPGCQRVSATCGGVPATHQLAHYKSSQKCHLNQWPFGNNAMRQNLICKTTGLFCVHAFLKIFILPSSSMSLLAEHGIKWKMFNMSCLTQTIRFSCVSSRAWHSFLYFLILHAAQIT